MIQGTVVHTRNWYSYLKNLLESTDSLFLIKNIVSSGVWEFYALAYSFKLGR
jgi:hypothetical protein